MTAEIVRRLSVSLAADGYDVGRVDITAVAGSTRIEVVVAPARLFKKRRKLQ